MTDVLRFHLPGIGSGNIWFYLLQSSHIGKCYLLLFSWVTFKLFHFWDHNILTSFHPSLSTLQILTCAFLCSFKFIASFFVICIFMCIKIPKYRSAICSVSIMFLVCMFLELTIWYWITNRYVLSQGDFISYSQCSCACSMKFSQTVSLRNVRRYSYEVSAMEPPKHELNKGNTMDVLNCSSFKCTWLT